MTRDPQGYQRLFADMKRRAVFKVAAVYGAVAFVVLQVADLIFPALDLPEWTLTFVVALAALGFPIALVLAWAFETTPEGVRRTDPASSGELEAIVAQPIGRRWPSGLLALAGDRPPVRRRVVGHWPGGRAGWRGRRSPKRLVRGDRSQPRRRNRAGSRRPAHPGRPAVREHEPGRGERPVHVRDPRRHPHPALQAPGPQRHVAHHCDPVRQYRNEPAGNRPRVERGPHPGGRRPASRRSHPDQRAAHRR